MESHKHLIALVLSVGCGLVLISGVAAQRFADLEAQLAAVKKDQATTSEHLDRLMELTGRIFFKVYRGEDIDVRIK